MSTAPIPFKRTLLAAGLAVFLLAPASASAQVRGRKGPALAPLIQQLKQARQLLHEGNRDYGGHRVKAMAEIGKAIYVLARGTLPPPRPAAQTGQGQQPGQVAPGQQKPGQSAPGQQPPPGSAIKENQAASNTQMRQARQILNNVLGQLSTVQTFPRPAMATPLVRQALEEINRGLAYARQQEKKTVPPTVK
jgi:hypothetical protein